MNVHWFYNPYVNKEGDHPDDYQFQHVFLLPDRGVVTDCMFALQPFLIEYLLLNGSELKQT